eukprot:153128-Amphidinium_carterae.1
MSTVKFGFPFSLPRLAAEATRVPVVKASVARQEYAAQYRRVRRPQGGGPPGPGPGGPPGPGPGAPTHGHGHHPQEEFGGKIK